VILYVLKIQQKNKKKINALGAILSLWIVYGPQNYIYEFLPTSQYGFPSEEKWQSDLLFYDEKNIIAFVMVSSPVTKEAIFSIRGTVMTSLKDWEINLDFLKVQNKWLGHEVHHGWEDKIEIIMNNPLFTQVYTQWVSSGYRILCTGHSQGAATSAVLAGMIYKTTTDQGLKPDLEILVFGEARPGSKALSEQIMKWIPRAVRIINGIDPVPRILPLVLDFLAIGKRLSFSCTDVDPISCHFATNYYKNYIDHIGYTSKMPLYSQLTFN